MRSYTTQRIFDLIVSGSLLVALSPLFLASMIWIRLDSAGPIFFLQERVGRHGRRFKIYKFRTMVADAELRGAQITIGEDPRITRSGRLLRHYRIDELPQLLNVLKGDMSIVGPRPEVPRYVDEYTPEQREILSFRPGMTSPATVSLTGESILLGEQSDPESFYREHLIPVKISTDLEYSRNAGFISDVTVLLTTVLKLLDAGHRR
ncbi:MAG: sugar transferase [Acidobacteria bacterium]|nr:sugar transferase [Acidobacteriota bacterium]